MHGSEMLAASLFIIAIGFVYCTEAGLIACAVYARMKKRPARVFLLTKPAVVMHVAAVIGIVCFAHALFIEPYWIDVTHVEIETEKLKSTSLRIALFSDTHCERPRNEKKLVELVNAAEPDIVVFAGDSLNRSDALGLFRQTLKGINAKVRKFAVRGNFDIWYWGTFDLFEGTGFQELNRDSVTLVKNGESFTVSGVACSAGEDQLDVLRDIPAERFSIFLDHYSDLVESLDGCNVDLYLSGHTHGGQVCLPFYGAIVTLSKFGKKYESGLYQIGETTLYVNRGIGMESGLVPRVRFLARPELTIIDVKPQKEVRQ
jgi:predicted MPP superfamily phosphohydrolase